MRDEHSQRTYDLAKDYILTEPENPMGKGLAKQLIGEASKLSFKMLGIGLLVLANALRKHPKQVNQAIKILKK